MLKFETKFVTHNWDKHANLSIFGMYVVDSWIAFSQYTESNQTQKEFFSHLADELIENNYDNQRGVGRGGATTQQKED